MDTSLLLIALTVGASVAMASVYVVDRVTAPARAVRQRVIPSVRRSSAAAPPLRRTRGGGLLAPIARAVPLSAPAREAIRVDLMRAGQPFRFEEFVMLRLVLASLGVAASVVVGARLVGLPGLATAGIAAGAGLGGWMLPAMLVARIRERRLRRIEQALPEALTVIAKAMRAGAGLMQALGFAAEEVADPLGAELRATLRDLQLGADPEETFEALADRVGSQDLDIAVTAIIIQRSIGGNLSEILTTIRERARLTAEVLVLTSRQRLTANLMAALPPAVAVLFIMLNPEMGTLLLTTVAGRIALAIGIGFEIIGLLVIRRIAQIEV